MVRRTVSHLFCGGSTGLPGGYSVIVPVLFCPGALAGKRRKLFMFLGFSKR